MRLFLILILVFLFHLFVLQTASARDISITAVKTSLFSDEELVVTASSSGFTNGEQIYIKGAFYQDGTSNYFGFTKNNNDWIKNSASSESQRSIKIGEWDSNLVIKNDPLDTGYKGNGGYKFKVGFYYITSGGNVSSVNWSTNSIDVSLAYPTSVPTTPPTHTPVPTNIPTFAPTKIFVPTIVATRAISRSPTQKNRKIESKSVLGVQKIPSVTKIPTPTDMVESSRNFVMPPLFLLVGIIIIITGCGILLFQEWKKQKELEL